MRAVVIGAGGFLGRQLCQSLLSRGWYVSAVDLRPPNIAHCRLTAVKSDAIRGDTGVGKGTNAVFFLAQSIYYRDFPVSAEDLFGTNTMGPIRAATEAVKTGARFLAYTSTGSVYEASHSPLNEEMPLNRKDPYALSKICAEDALDLFRPHLVTVSLRLFALFGPGQRSMLPATLYNRIRQGEPIYLERAEGEASPTKGLRLSFTHVCDCANCLVRLAELALDGRQLPSRLNLAAPEAISVHRFAEMLGKCLGISPLFEYSDQKRIFDLVADTRRLQDLMGPVFTPLEKAMRLSYTDMVDGKR